MSELYNCANASQASIGTTRTTDSTTPLLPQSSVRSLTKPKSNISSWFRNGDKEIDAARSNLCKFYSLSPLTNDTKIGDMYRTWLKELSLTNALIEELRKDNKHGS